MKDMNDATAVSSIDCMLKLSLAFAFHNDRIRYNVLVEVMDANKTQPKKSSEKMLAGQPVAKILFYLKSYWILNSKAEYNIDNKNLISV